jgi:2,3-bisphosphoglycerate-independent phosphoglycerate mutase
MSRKPVILTILDGWGHSERVEGNAVALAHTPTFDRLWAANPHNFINTSGPWVGLPEGQMGNSEVGHMNLGAGRVLLMDVTRIDVAIETGEFFKNEKLVASMTHGPRLHLMGLVSDGGVHSHINHLLALLDMAKKFEVKEVFVHCFLDGRDTPPQTGADFVAQVQAHIAKIGLGKIATVSGRYYSMDRDKRWERTQRAFESMVLGNGVHATDPVAAIQASYAAGVTDEFIEPITIVDAAGQPVGLVANNDACIFFNYRADRGRQLSRAFVDAGLDVPWRALMPKPLHFTCMTQYDATIPAPIAFDPVQPTNILADVLGRAGITNLRTAETEKYPHVTFYFNGGVEKPFPGEARELVPSDKTVATYDLKPEMSAAGITDVVVRAIEQKKFDVIVMNYANGDMVGHSGKLEPTIKAIEEVDRGLARIEAALNGAGSWIITADHGNAETMIDPVTGGPHTYHTTNPVPLIYVSEPKAAGVRSGGALRDISPTILAILGIEKPAEMSGEDLRILE